VLIVVENHACGPEICLRLSYLAASQIVLIPFRDVFPTFDTVMKNREFKNWEAKYVYKLAVFNLTAYDRVVWLDTDIVVLRSLVGLFERSVFLDKPLLVEPNICFNTGVMVIKPSATLFINLLEFAMFPSGDLWPVTCVWSGLLRDADDTALIEAYFQMNGLVDYFQPEFHFSLHISNGDPSSTNKGAYFVQEIESAFSRWILRDHLHRIHAVHFIWPKPVWLPVWNTKQKYMAFAGDPEVGVAVISIAKQFFHDTSMRLNDICVRSIRDSLSADAVCTADLTPFLTKWCQVKHNILPAGYEEMVTLLLDSEIPLVV